MRGRTRGGHPNAGVSRRTPTGAATQDRVWASREPHADKCWFTSPATGGIIAILELRSIIAWMIPRRLLSRVPTALAEVPAVAILGPRQVGKATLALTVAATHPSLYLDLESEPDRAKLADPEQYLARHADKLVILDHIQRVPQLFQSLRGLIDRGHREGRTCSARGRKSEPAPTAGPRGAGANRRGQVTPGGARGFERTHCAVLHVRQA